MNTQQTQKTSLSSQLSIGTYWLWLGLGILIIVAALAIALSHRTGRCRNDVAGRRTAVAPHAIVWRAAPISPMSW